MSLSSKRRAYRDAQREHGYGAPETRAAHREYQEAQAEADEKSKVRTTKLRNGATLKRRGRGNRIVIDG